MAVIADSARIRGETRESMSESTRKALARLTLSDRASIGPRELMRRYRCLVIGADALAGLGAGVMGLALRFGDEATPAYVSLSLVAPVLWVAAVAGQRGYEGRFLGTGPEEYRRLADATLLLFALTAAASFAFKSELSRGYVMISLPLALLLSFMMRRTMRGWLFKRRLAGQGLHRVLVVGRADAVSHLVEQFDREPWHGLVAVGACVPASEGSRDGGDPNRPSGSTKAESDGGEAALDSHEIVKAVDDLQVGVVAVASNPDLSGHALRRLAWELEERGVELIVSPGIVEVAGPRLSIRPIAGLSLLHLERPVTRGGRMIVKGVLDRLVGLAMIVLGSPVLVVAACAVKFTSRGPVIFRQTRIGVRGEPFQMLKFRSMVVDAEDRLRDLRELNENDGLLFKMRDDPRVTRVGAVIRRFSIDELPQLWNVVRGEMSLVGPRPPLPVEVEKYDTDATRRLRVRPGLTGLWQVSGRSDLTWEESLRLDLRYVDNWSFWLDMAILWRTWRAVLGRSGAY